MSVSAGKFLNVGCGRDVRTEPGWVNLDLPVNTALRQDLDIAGDVCDRDSWHWVGAEDYPFFEEDEPPFDHIVASHVIEHVPDVLAMMENLWHVSAAGTTIEIRCPHGASDDADEDPTHVRRMFPSSFHYFAQYAYWRADYGYRADWQLDKLVLVVGEQWAKVNPAVVYEKSRQARNVVIEMVAAMTAVKPARPAERQPWHLPIEIAVGTARREE
jgi:hypothetical protein